MLQEATFTLGLLGVAPLLEAPDVMVAVSPSLPALSAAITISRARGIPWVLWLQDMVSEAALTTALVRSRGVLSVAHRLESAAYRSAARIVVVSDAFRANLRKKGVPDGKITTIYNPATLPELDHPQSNGARDAGDQHRKYRSLAGASPTREGFRGVSGAPATGRPAGHNRGRSRRARSCGTPLRPTAWNS